MKKFVIKTFLFLIVYLTSVALVRLVAKPEYYWGNQYYSNKIEHLNEGKDSINTIFIGSSRIYRSIDPALFDSLVNADLPEQDRIHSFNLGTPATFQSEIYMLCSSLIENSTGLRYIFMEVNYQPDIANLSSVRGSYWMGWNQARFCWSEIWNDPIHQNRVLPSLEIAGALTQNYLTLRYITNDQEEVDFACGTRNDGYYSLDAQYAEHSRAESFREHEQFLNDTGIVRARSNNIRNVYQNFTADNSRTIHLKVLEDLKNACAAKHIELILVVMPRTIDNHALNVVAQWSGKNKLDYGDPRKYPALYSDSLSFDVGHLNGKGGIYFTRLLANDFSSIVKR